jgi:hypothetical protein
MITTTAAPRSRGVDSLEITDMGGRAIHDRAGFDGGQIRGESALYLLIIALDDN